MIRAIVSLSQKP